MNGLNLNQIDQILNTRWICDRPGCDNKPHAPGFKIKPTINSIKFIQKLWYKLFDEFLSDAQIINTLSHENNTLKLCKYHIRDFEIDVQIDPGEAQKVLESIYRGMNG